MRKRQWKKKSRRRFVKVRRTAKKWAFPDLATLGGDPYAGEYDPLVRGR